jgi:SAM-dependent methyltransferase
MNGFDPARDYGRAHAADYDARLDAEVPPDAAVETLTALAGGGPALELGVGTGRVAIPLAQRGVDVVGIDSSPEMLDQLRAKPGAENVTVVEADMASFRRAERYPLIYCVFNSLFWLTDQDSQVTCLANAAEHLAPDGRLVIEIELPDLSGYHHDRAVTVSMIERDRVRLVAAIHDPLTQTLAFQHISIGDSTRLQPMYVRYVTPAELHLMARLAGLRPLERWADWHQRPYRGRTHCINIFGR